MSITTHDSTAVRELTTDTISFYISAQPNDMSIHTETTVPSADRMAVEEFFGVLRQSSLVKSFERLDEIAKLERDWDSYGSEPPSLLAIIVSRALLHKLDQYVPVSVNDRVPPYSIAPLSGGGVQIEWRGATGVLEVEVEWDGSLSCLIIETRGGNRTTQEKDSVSESELLDLIVSVVS